MTYKVIIQPDAEAELEAIYRWIMVSSPQGASRWITGLSRTLNRLELFPDSCPLAPEDKHFEDEIRQLLYGKRGGMYRILFTIKHREVHVLHIRHCARQYIK